jgi:hypothetical protein
VEAVERLGRTPLRPELVRAHLLYGEWLRGENRRTDARHQLRTACDLLTAIGAEAFAQRTRSELLATGEKVRKRTADVSHQLTPQEEHIVRLARDGRTNREIAAELFLSPAPWNGTSARCSPSSASPPARNLTRRWPGPGSTRPPASSSSRFRAGSDAGGQLLSLACPIGPGGAMSDEYWFRRGPRVPGEEELIYAQGQLSVDQIQAEIARFWQDLDNPDDPALDTELSAAGRDRAELADVDRKTAIDVRPGGSGVDPVTTVLVVALAPSANRIVKDIWATVLLPRIRRRWGDDAIGEEKRGQD